MAILESGKNVGAKVLLYGGKEERELGKAWARTINRRHFLKLSGASLAGAA
jgi:hypothetical protein